MAAFVPGTGLQLILCSGSRSHRGTTLHPEWISATRGQDDIDNNLWLEVLRPFIAVKSLYISRASRLRIADALKMLVGESVTEVLRAPQTLFLGEPGPSGSVQENTAQFVAAR